MWNDVMMTSSLCLSESVYKTCQRQPTELKLGKLIVHLKFHEIYKFENHVTTNDVIMTSLLKQWKNADLRETKQIIYHSKGIDESYPKMYILLNLSHYVKRYGHLCQILAIFTVPAPQIWPCHVTQEANLEKILVFPNFAFNIRKSYKISSWKALHFRSYQPKTSQGCGKHPPHPALLGLRVGNFKILGCGHPVWFSILKDYVLLLFFATI